MKRRAATAALSDFGPEIIDPTTGEIRRAVAIVVEDIAAGTRATVKRARRADPLSRVDGCTDAMRVAAAIYRQATEHVECGRGMGPMPWAAERVHEGRRGDGLGVALLPQERALSAAEWRRRGVDAMGARCVHVVDAVCVAGVSLLAYDAFMRWRKGGGRAVLLAGLTVLAEEYGV